MPPFLSPSDLSSRNQQTEPVNRIWLWSVPQLDGAHSFGETLQDRFAAAGVDHHIRIGEQRRDMLFLP